MTKAAEPISGSGFVQLASGLSLLCGLHMDGHVECNGSRVDEWDADSAPYPSGERFEEISAGDGFVCGITANQDVKCWGGDGDGRTAVPVGLKAVSLADNPL